MELAASLGFLLFGIAYFSWGMNRIDLTQREQRNHEVAVDREQYQRRINEQREFGYQAVSRDPPPPSQESKHKK